MVKLSLRQSTSIQPLLELDRAPFAFGVLAPVSDQPLGDPSGDRLADADRPKHWMEFAPFEMCHKPLKMTIAEARNEVDRAWSSSYSPERNWEAIDYLATKPVGERITHLLARIAFRGIYFPQVSRFQWFKAFGQNWRLAWSLAMQLWDQKRPRQARVAPAKPVREADPPSEQASLSGAGAVELLR